MSAALINQMTGTWPLFYNKSVLTYGAAAMSMSNLTTDDPALAIVIDRLERLSSDFKEHRVEVNSQMASLKKEVEMKFDALQQPVSKMTSIMNKAQGGYLVILGLGALLSYAVGLWDKLLKVFHG